MGEQKFNIDKVSDDQYFSITEAMALAASAIEDKGTETLLVISLGSEGNDAILGGTLNAERIEKLEELLLQLKDRALEEEPDDAMVLHLEETN